RQGKDQSRLRESDGSQQWLQMEPVRHVDDLAETVGESVSDEPVGRREHRQTPCLVAPELVIPDQVGELFFESSHLALVGIGFGELVDGFGYQVLQGDALRLSRTGGIGRQVDRDTGRAEGGEETADLVAGRYVDV